MAKPARTIKPVVGTHDDTATSTRETIVQYYAVHMHGEVALTQPNEVADEARLIERLTTDEYLRLNLAHTLLKKTVEVVHKGEPL